MVDCVLLNSLRTCATQVLRPCRNFFLVSRTLDPLLVKVKATLASAEVSAGAVAKADQKLGQSCAKLRLSCAS